MGFSELMLERVTVLKTILVSSVQGCGFGLFWVLLFGFFMWGCCIILIDSERMEGFFILTLNSFRSLASKLLLNKQTKKIKLA